MATGELPVNAIKPTLGWTIGTVLSGGYGKHGLRLTFSDDLRRANCLADDPAPPWLQ